MEHLWWNLGGVAGGAQFEVSLRGSPARVCLMEADDYDTYVGDSGEYEFHGGFYDMTPVVLDVPHDGHWYVVVDSWQGHLKATVEQVFD